jgi:plasmid stabilization system protein ParE
MQAPLSVGAAAYVAEYRRSPAAERDLESIWKYTRREWGLEQANRYTDLLTTAFRALAEAPKSAPACDHIRPGYNCSLKICADLATFADSIQGIHDEQPANSPVANDKPADEHANVGPT